MWDSGHGQPDPSMKTGLDQPCQHKCGQCVTQRRDERTVRLEKRKEIDHLEYPDVGGGMALIEILKTWVVMEWIGLNWLRI